MKRRIALLLMFVMILSVFAGCGGNKEAVTEQTGKEPVAEQTGKEPAAAQSGKEAASEQTGKEPAGEAAPAKEYDEDSYLNALIGGEPSTLDVAKFMNMYDRTVLNNTLEPLTRIRNGVVVGAGAETWDVSSDGLTYTFHLRDNVWSDGQPVTAADYECAFKRMADPKNAWALASDFYNVKNFKAIYEGTEPDVEKLGVTALDEKTLEVQMDNVDVTLLTLSIFPCRADLVEKYGEQYGSEVDTVLSCGPFVLDEWVHNATLSFSKNPTFWGADEIKLSKFTLHIMNDMNARMSAFEAGELDYIGVSNAEYIAKFSADDRFESEKVSAGRTVMIIFNCADEILQNQKIRLALSISLDRDSLAEVITGGTAVAAYGLIPADSSVGVYNYRAEVEEPLKALMSQDPKALFIEGMKELGLGDDPSTVTLTLSWGGTTADARTYAELYQSMWRGAIGCKIELEFNDSTTHMANINQGKTQLASASWGADPEPKFQLTRWANKKGGQSNWNNPEYIQYCNTASSTTDDKARLEAYAAAEKMLIENAAIAPVYYTGSYRYNYPYVKGLSTSTFDNDGMMSLYTFGRE